MAMILRQRHEKHVLRLLDNFPVVAILGARQVGKTTLAQRIMEARKGRRNGSTSRTRRTLPALKTRGWHSRDSEGSSSWTRFNGGPT